MTTSTIPLSDASLQIQNEHHETMLQLEIQKRAHALVVPTLPKQVHAALRDLGEPICFFGENPANVRDRLRSTMARREVLLERMETAKNEGEESDDDEEEEEEEDKRNATTTAGDADGRYPAAAADDDDDDSTKYTIAPVELIEARKTISHYSLAAARRRLETERRRRRLETLRKEEGDAVDELDDLDAGAERMYGTIKRMGLDGSQYGGEGRILSAISCRGNDDDDDDGGEWIATGGWSGCLQLWDGELNNRGEKRMAHEDRIMGVDFSAKSMTVASASIDLTGKLWRVRRRRRNDDDDDDGDDKNRGGGADLELGHVLRGHQARLCKTAFHPLGDYVGTTSFDHSWRLWSVETGQELLLQDGHWKETYGIGFHRDGSLCSTTDFGSVVQVWDLRSGRSIVHYLGHAKRVLCSQFHPNGFQLVTAGDDGTMKIWDLRQRKLHASIPAHSKLISQISVQDEYITSCSFDGTVKFWSCRDWKLLASLQGHEGKVMGVDVLNYGPAVKVVTVGYDKTLKLWR